MLTEELCMLNLTGTGSRVVGMDDKNVPQPEHNNNRGINESLT